MVNHGQVLESTGTAPMRLITDSEFTIILPRCHHQIRGKITLLFVGGYRLQLQFSDVDQEQKKQKLKYKVIGR